MSWVKNLINFAIQIKEAESFECFETFPVSQFETPRWCFLDEVPFAAFKSPALMRLLVCNNEAVKTVADSVSMKSLVVGYPVLKLKSSGQHIKGKNHPVLVPLLFWVVDPKVGHSQFCGLNHLAVQELTRSNLEEAEFMQALEDIGQTTDLRQFENLLEATLELVMPYFFSHKSDWYHKIGDYKAKFLSRLPIDRDDNRGIYNRCMVFPLRMANYNDGLLKELRLMREMPESKFKGTALLKYVEARFGDAPKALKEKPLYDGLLVEDQRRLNDSQRHCVTEALSQDVTIIQGPPGTGKTQVVKNIYLNALLQGQKVLFTSVNTAAIDAVVTQDNNVPTILNVSEAGKAKDKTGGQKWEEARVMYEARAKVNAKATSGLTINELATGRVSVTELKRMAELHDKRKSLVEQKEAIFAEMEKLNTSWTGYAAFLKALPTANLKDQRLYRALAALVEDITQDLDAFQVLKTKPIDISWEWLRTQILLWLNKKCLTQKIEKFHKRLAEAGYDADVLGYWQDSLVASFKELESLSSWLDNLESFVCYARVNEKLVKMPSRFECDRQLLAIDEERVKRSAYIIEHLPYAIFRAHNGQKRLERLENNHVSVDNTVCDEHVELIRAVACKALSANKRVPLSPALFDLLIVDEAGQVDTLAILPMLFRAKRVAVVGDPKQLSPVGKLSAALVKQISLAHDNFTDVWPYGAESSFFTLSLGVNGQRKTMLNGHYRCHPDIARFVSEAFYGGELYDSVSAQQLHKPLAHEAGIVWLDVDNGNAWQSVNEKTKNTFPAEVERVVEAVKTLLVQGVKPSEIGVVVAFRNQAWMIVDALKQQCPGPMKEGLLVATAHGFQGGERQVIIYSLCVGTHLSKGALHFLESNINLFNVAVTRAKQQVLVVGDSRAVAKHPTLAIYKALYDYSLGLDVETPSHDDGLAAKVEMSPLEAKLAAALDARGITYEREVRFDRYILDFVFKCGDRRLDVELDGEQFHRTPGGRLRYYDQLRNDTMARAGWDVKRYWTYRVMNDVDGIVDEIKAWLNAG